jgi:2-polyprenyl-3-methyl-5-hydroxy-6-metoxy-1,4-benzoquinol methylase
LVLEHVADLAPMLREIARVLRAGGRAVITDIHPAMRARTQANFTDPSTGHDVLPPSHLHHARDYVEAARAAGLSVAHHAEHFGTDALVRKTERARKYLGEPMLLAFAFEKNGERTA